MSVKDCCQVEANLVLRADHPAARPDLEVRECEVCGCRHFTLLADPGRLTADVARMG